MAENTWVTGVITITLLIGVITPFVTVGGPSCISLDIQNPPVIPGEEVFGTPKSLLSKDVCFFFQHRSSPVGWMSRV